MGKTGTHAPRQPARGRIYRYLHRTRQFCSKQDLAQALGISMPTVYQNLNGLMDSGLVGYSGQRQATGGRSAQGVAIVPEARLAVGLSVMDDFIRLALVDLRLRQMAYKVIPFQYYPDNVEGIVRELETFLDEEQVDRSRLLGVGIAIPGILSADGRQLLFAPTLHLRDTSLDKLYEQIPYPVHVENDANCGCRAEWFIRDHKHDMAYLSLEGGVGGSIFIGDKPYTGTHQRSGEFGHMCVEPGGLPCSCGRRGCLEAYCSVRRIHAEGFTSEQFFHQLADRNPVCQALWGDMLRHLAIGISNIHMALDCDVILGGHLTGYIEPWLPLLQEYVSHSSLLDERADYLHLSILRSHSSVLGAACHFVQAFIDSI